LIAIGSKIDLNFFIDSSTFDILTIICNAQKLGWLLHVIGTIIISSDAAKNNVSSYYVNFTSPYGWNSAYHILFIIGLLALVALDNAHAHRMAVCIHDFFLLHILILLQIVGFAVAGFSYCTNAAASSLYGYTGNLANNGFNCGKIK
jgi:hypothetical protein